MKIIFQPIRISGIIKANPSKSHTQRAVAIGAYYNVKMKIYDPCLSEDCLAAVAVAMAMGNEINVDQKVIEISKRSKALRKEWFIGEAGLSARIFGVLAASFESELTLQGHGSILNRPLKGLEHALQQLGVKFESNNSQLPFKIKGPVTKYNIEIDAAMSSQVLSGLLILLPALKKDSKLRVKDLKSVAYIDITLDMLKHFGIEINHENYEIFDIKGDQKLKQHEIQIEGDWSGAAFYCVAGALSDGLTIENISLDSSQGDKAIIEVLKEVGADVRVDGKKVSITKNQLKAFTYDATGEPDLFPPLAALAANCEGVSRIRGIHRLVHKESNRYESLKIEFEKLGIIIEKEGDEMLIHGASIKGGHVYSHNDHRIAMALAILSINATESIRIDGFECINKSYPAFLEDFKSLGGDFQVLDA